MLLDLARRMRNYPGRLVHRAVLSRRRLVPPAGSPVLAYGGAQPRPGEIVHGGRVKLLYLLEHFAHSETQFNLLYLVSSAAPRHAREEVEWAKRAGARLVWNQNGVGFPAWAGTDSERINRPMSALLRLADHVIYQSAFCRESADRWLGSAACPSAVLFNPVNLAAFAPAPAPPSLDRWRLLAAGTHHQPFRVLGAIETLRHLRDDERPASLTIAGELRWPRAEAEVRAAIAEAHLEDDVELRPPFTQPEAAALLRGSHLLLHAKYHDPCPTMVIEALACGVSVVGSRSGGMPELVGDDGGELIEVPLSWESASYPSPAEMAVAIIRLMRDWPARSRAARARAERLFSAQAWLEAHAAIFRGLV